MHFYVLIIAFVSFVRVSLQQINFITIVAFQMCFMLAVILNKS